MTKKLSLTLLFTTSLCTFNAFSWTLKLASADLMPLSNPFPAVTLVATCKVLGDANISALMKRSFAVINSNKINAGDKIDLSLTDGQELSVRVASGAAVELRNTGKNMLQAQCSLY